MSNISEFEVSDEEVPPHEFFSQLQHFLSSEVFKIFYCRTPNRQIFKCSSDIYLQTIRACKSSQRLNLNHPFLTAVQNKAGKVHCRAKSNEQVKKLAVSSNMSSSFQDLPMSVRSSQVLNCGYYRMPNRWLRSTTQNWLQKWYHIWPRSVIELLLNQVWRNYKWSAEKCGWITRNRKCCIHDC